MSSTSLPAGYSPPSTLVTATDHSGWITVTAALGLCVVLLFYAIKLYIRTEFSLPFRRDDAVLTVATVPGPCCRLGERCISNGEQAFFVVQTSVTLAQVASGFGRTIESISFPSLVEVQKVKSLAPTAGGDLTRTVVLCQRDPIHIRPVLVEMGCHPVLHTLDTRQASQPALASARSLLDAVGLCIDPHCRPSMQSLTPMDSV